MDRSFLPLGSLGFALVVVEACGGGASNSVAKQAEAPQPSPSSSAASADAPAASAGKAEESSGAPGDISVIPKTCADGQGEGICAPPRSFVKALCGTYPKPDIALILFSKSSPFTHGYMNRNLEAWYTSGQQSTSAKLVFDEEVVILAHIKPKA